MQRGAFVSTCVHVHVYANDIYSITIRPMFTLNRVCVLEQWLGRSPESGHVNQDRDPTTTKWCVLCIWTLCVQHWLSLADR